MSTIINPEAAGIISGIAPPFLVFARLGLNRLLQKRRAQQTFGNYMQQNGNGHPDKAAVYKEEYEELTGESIEIAVTRFKKKMERLKKKYKKGL